VIDIKTLKLTDIGREVCYTCIDGERAYGRLSSWNHKFVFVRFKSVNGEACDPEQCEFTSGRLSVPA
jgi:hypothetical protein